MFRASLCPSPGDQDRVLLHTVFCTGCAGCSCVELGRKLCALCEGHCRTVHAARSQEPKTLQNIIRPNFNPSVHYIIHFHPCTRRTG